MIGFFLARALILAFGYAYPAYECYKTVELNKPEIARLRFWCQYWILVAILTVLERFTDPLISWLPFYGEAKLCFFIYLWYPKTKGTAYVYETFFKPFMSKHEREIDRNLIEKQTETETTRETNEEKTDVPTAPVKMVPAKLLRTNTKEKKESFAISSPVVKKPAVIPSSPVVKKSSVVVPSSPVETIEEAELEASSSDETGEDEKEKETEESAIEETIRLTRARLRKRMGNIGTGSGTGTGTGTGAASNK
ncbi:hypothetical protein LUZ60_011869 [Juncus effusus]|nr:hypothetical protein LUZ60_011869 [Juncus effusus]